MDSHHLEHKRKLETYILSVYDVDTDVHCCVWHEAITQREYKSKLITAAMHRFKMNKICPKHHWHDLEEKETHVYI